MPIAVKCTHCGSRLKAKDSLVGKTLKCPGCGKPVVVSETAATALEEEQADSTETYGLRETAPEQPAEPAPPPVLPQQEDTEPPPSDEPRLRSERSPTGIWVFAAVAAIELSLGIVVPLVLFHFSLRCIPPWLLYWIVACAVLGAVHLVIDHRVMVKHAFEKHAFEQSPLAGVALFSLWPLTVIWYCSSSARGSAIFNGVFALIGLYFVFYAITRWDAAIGRRFVGVVLGCLPGPARITG